MKESITNFDTRYQHCKVVICEGQASGSDFSGLPLSEASLLKIIFRYIYLNNCRFFLIKMDVNGIFGIILIKSGQIVVNAANSDRPLKSLQKLHFKVESSLFIFKLSSRIVAGLCNPKLGQAAKTE